METSSVLGRTGIWVARHLFPRLVRNRVQIPIPELLDALNLGRSQPLSYPVSGNLRLGGHLGPAELIDLEASERALVIRARMPIRLRLTGGSESDPLF